MPSAPLHWTAALVVLWLAGAMCVAGVLLRGWLGVRRMEREAERVEERDWRGLLEAARERMGVRRPVLLLRDRASTTPLTWGSLRPAVLLPGGADGWPRGHREAVLLHELAHVRRWDCLLQILAQVACALFWFHPGVWWLTARLQAEREVASDDLVLASGVRPSDYAECLLRIADTIRDGGRIGSVAVSAGMVRRSRLKERLHAVLDAGRPRREPSRAAGAVMALVALALVTSVGSARLAPSTRVLVDALESPRWETRLYAASLLAAGDPGAAPVLSRVARSDPSAMVRHHAAIALRRLRREQDATRTRRISHHGFAPAGKPWCDAIS